MRLADRPRYIDMVAQLLAPYRVQLDTFNEEVWWYVVEPHDPAAVKSALVKLASSADGTGFPPLPGQLAALLSGKTSDNARRAWAMLDAAIGPIGAYKDVVIDEPAAAYALQAIGGWIRFCRTPDDERSYAQTEFCKAYQAFVSSPTPLEAPVLMRGEVSADDVYRAVGMRAPRPELIGDRRACIERLCEISHECISETTMLAYRQSKSAAQTLLVAVK